MDILALVAVALLRLAALTFEEMQETVNAIETVLVEQYVEPVHGTQLAERITAAGEAGEAK
jgi:hypothetical protein